MRDLSTFSAPNLDVFFNSKRASVDGKLTGRLTAFIAGTQSMLDVAIYDLTEPSVLTALTAVAKTGDKRLRLAYDASGERPTNTMADPKPGKTHAAIKRAGLERYATPVYMTGRHLMHDKFLVWNAPGAVDT